MSLGAGNLLLASAGDAGYNLTRSLRVRSSATAYLNRTPASATNQKTWTWSGWVKRGALGADQSIFESSNNAGIYTLCWFTSADQIQITQDNGAGGVLNVTTNAVFRDPSAWYHVVISIDTTQATANNRTIFYVNGVNQSLTYTTQLAQNANTWVNFTYQHRIGRRVSGTAALDAYLAEVNFIDGQALTPSSFGSTNALTGVWQPARYTGTYGTNGFYLPFTDNSALTTSSNVGLGKDFSGNGNYWVTNNISITAGVTYDSMTDVPTLTSATASNFCVMNPLRKGTDNTVTDGNLKSTFTSFSFDELTTATIGVTSGKWYFEGVVDIGSSRGSNIGILATSVIVNTSATAYQSALLYAYIMNSGNKFNNNTSTAYGAACTTGDIVGVAFDLDNGKIWFSKNGTWQASGDPAAGTNPAFSGLTAATYTPSFYTWGNQTWVANFGQRPFTYTPPTGFVALNTFNLPTSTIVKGNTVMDATLWAGNSSTQSIVNAAAFKTDFVWIKNRTGANNHALFDSVRGATLRLYSDSTIAEQTEATTLTAFNSNGFSVSTSGAVNASANNYVGWQWQAGQGSSSSNTNGTITSTVSVNASAGFSVVTYTGTAVAGTIGHGLGVAPQLIIVKPRSATITTDAWNVYHVSTGNTNFLVLNATDASAAASNRWNNTSPTSSVFSIGTVPSSVAVGYVAYCWTPIAGFSAFGSYTGNGSTDGPFVYTGFRPKFILAKKISSSGDWNILDGQRDPYNAVGTYLNPNLSAAEGANAATLDFTANGFKLRQSYGNWNTSGETYIYACFAENPFKNSLAR